MRWCRKSNTVLTAVSKLTNEVIVGVSIVAIPKKKPD
jgi:hypothetical protein